MQIVKSSLFAITASFSLLIISLSVAYYFVYFLPHEQNRLEQAKVLSETKIASITQTPELTTTLTPSPTSTTKPINKSVVKPNETDSCEKLIEKLGAQYRDIYVMDDILLASNMECHYYLQTRLGIAVNNGHIRDQRDLLLSKLKAMYPSNQTYNNSIQCNSFTYGSNGQFTSTSCY